MSNNLQITFLGTGTSSGVPMIACNCEVCLSTNTKDKRLRSSILVKKNNTTIVVDTTPDFRTQMLQTHTQQLSAVLFTHPHKDHTAGLDDIRAFNHFQKKAMPLYGNEMTLNAIKQDYSYAFAEKKYPGIPQFDLHLINHQDNFFVEDICVKPLLVWHLQMPVLAFRFDDFTYITDANRIDEVEKEKIKGSKVLVLNALRKEKHISHFTLQEAIDLANELQIPQVYFTHISHQLGLHDEVEKELPTHIKLAYDGLTINL